MRFGLMILMLGMSFTAPVGSAAADKPHRLAYSPKLGVEVLAEAGGGAWCRDTLQLQVIAKDGGLFQGDGIQTLMSKLGGVIKAECAGAKLAEAQGFVEGSKTSTYQASTNKASGWTLEPVASLFGGGNEARQQQVTTQISPESQKLIPENDNCKIKVQDDWVYFQGNRAI